MALFPELILWALTAAPMVANSLFHLPKGVNLSRYHEPWRLITLPQDVYLLLVSGGSSRNQKALCVRSRPLKTDRKLRTALRTLDFYSKNDRHSDLKLKGREKHQLLSINISLDAPNHDEIEVNVTSEIATFIMSNVKEVQDSDLCIGQYKFPVLFADNRCLLLETRKSGHSDSSMPHSRRYCLLWIPEFDMEAPLSCCLYMFYILCGQGVHVSRQSCL
ncbi:uncharacterized protein LOC142813933 [Rhipicephalus microplus]|uniref:uncharacterized protein LOC142813933 n=1 Tax=Rhipicephalus microplus TaxID=6941 RepID=UPI003F6A9ADC